MKSVIEISGLLREAEEIQAFLEEDFVDDIHILSERGNRLSVYIARTSIMLADAKYWLNQSRGAEAIKAIDIIIGRQAKIAKRLQESMNDDVCKDYERLVDIITGLDKTAKHQLKWCITQISKEKELLRNNI